jgi:hypothetical protein
MAIVIVENLSKEDLIKAREEYPEYIKITADLEKKIVAIGGEYHADAEQILTEQFQSQKNGLWGGGYNITLHKFETNALINIKPNINDSPEILDPAIRQQFFDLVKEKLADIENLI